MVKPVVVLEFAKLCVALVRNGQGSTYKQALEEMEKTSPRFSIEAPRGERLADSRQEIHPLEIVGSTSALAKTPTTPTAPYAPYSHTSQPDYSGISQLSAAGKGCLACGSDHLSTATAALSEAIRFARAGDIVHPEVVSRITLAMDELNAFERIDGSPEKVTKLPANEKVIMDSMMDASREIRHHITDIKNPADLEKTASLAREHRIYFMAKQMKMQKAV